MIKKDYLFYLIKSLNQSEKRYFKLNTVHSKSSANYFELFDFIDKQNVYDEQAVKSKFKKSKFIKQLHVTKNYLTKIILKSLRNYYEQNSKGAELLDIIKNIDLLLYKELYEICLAEIERGLKIALEYEKWPENLIILDYKKRVYRSIKGKKRNSAYINEIIKHEENLIQKLRKLNHSWHLIYNIFDYTDSKSMDESYIKENYIPGSLNQNTLHNYIMMSIAFSKNNLDQAENWARETITVWEEKPEHIKEAPSSYITVINNLIGIYLQQRKYDLVEKYLLKIRQVPQKYKISKNNPVTSRAILHTYNVQLEIYRDTQQTERGCASIEEAESYLKKNQDRGPGDTILLLYYQFSHIYYLANRYPDSLNYLNKIINEKWDDQRQDIQSYAYLMYLVIHFELGNINLLRYAVEACRRFLKKKHDLKNFEKELLALFSKLSTRTESEHKELFKNYKKSIFENLSEKEKENILDYFNFEEWLEKQI